MLGDKELKIYEQYILNGRNLTPALDQLHAGSIPHSYLLAMHSLSQGDNSVIKDNKKLGDLLRGYPSGDMKTVHLRNQFLSYDQAKTPDEKQKILKGLQEAGYIPTSREYSKPTNLKTIASKKGPDQSNQEASEEDERVKGIPHTLKESELFNKDVILAKAIKFNTAHEIHPRYWPQLDYKEMNNTGDKSNARQFQTFFDSIQYVDFDNKSFWKAIKTLLSKEKYYSSLAMSLVSHFAVKDLLKLQSDHSIFNDNSFHHQIVMRKFPKIFLSQQGDPAQVFKDLTFEEKLELAESIKKFVSQKVQSTVSKAINLVMGEADIEKSTRYFIIHLLYQQNKFDESLFVKYCSSPNQNIGSFSNQKIQHSTWNYIFQQLDASYSNSNTINSVIKANIEHMFLKGVDIQKKIGKEFHTDYLKRILTQLSYLHNIPFDQNDEHYIENLKDQTLIELCHYNKSKFQINEEIEIFIQLKNIKKLQVKLFQINLEQYYRPQQKQNQGSLREFRTDINLDGLIPKYDQEYSYTEIPSQVQHTERFFFPEFNGMMGMFIIEFISNGISSRAIIQKGNLSLIHKESIAGTLVFILDESRQICKGHDTGLYFQGQFYKADDNSGQIIVPFGRQSRSGSALMIYKGFAQLTQFQQTQENYEFHAAIVMHDESMVMGNLAKILVKPFLILNQHTPADLRLLENTSITLLTQQQGNISTSKTFDDVRLTESEEYEIEFQVPSNVLNVTVAIRTEVNVSISQIKAQQAISKGSKQPFYQEKVFSIHNHYEDYDISEAFLRKVNDNYQYIIKGKNGEPKKLVPVNFAFNHLYFKNEQNAQLKTNENGIVNLGKLKNITSVKATPELTRVTRAQPRQWILPQKCTLQYPTSTIIINEEETFMIPFKHKKISSTNVSLLQIAKNTYIENKSQMLTFVKNEKNQFGVNHLKIGGLQEGEYVLNLKKEEQKIYINVHSGKLWNISKDFIMKQRSMIKRQQIPTDPLRIESVIKLGSEKVKGDKVEVTQTTLKVSLGGQFNHKNTKLHIWGFQFYPYDLEAQISQPLNNQQFLKAQAQRFDFANWKNFYLSNRQMSDENRYVLERKMQQEKIGNFLETPTMLLKRNYIRDTKFTEETLNQGSSYDNQKVDVAVAHKLESFQATNDTTAARKRVATSSQIKKGIQGFQNFLSHSCQVLSNVAIEVDQNGIAFAEFKVDSDLYTNYLIVAASDSSSTHLLYSQSENDLISQRNLSQQKSSDIEKSFAETRRAQECMKYDTFQIQDITSTEMQIVDSLAKVWQVQKELNQGLSSHKDLIESMIKWNSFSEEKKSSLYSQYYSHELNFFMKMKDPSYFEKVVKPFIQNKIEKTFIDYWLLSYDKVLLRYASPEKMCTLNSLEKCLLVQFLVKTENQDKAQEIFNGLKASVVEISNADMNKIYDTILNMNSLNKDKSEIEQQIRIDKEKSSRTDTNQLYRSVQRTPPPPGAFGGGPPPPGRGPAGAPGGPPRPPGGLPPPPGGAPRDEDSDPFDNDFEQLQDHRKTQKIDFKELDKTKEYEETHYYGCQSRTLSLTPNKFWLELALHLLKSNGSFQDFCSQFFTISNRSINETIFSLALLDFPQDQPQGGNHGYRTGEGRIVDIKAASNFVIFLKEIQEAKTELNQDLLIVHRYFEKGKSTKEVEEFLINEVYQCQIIITNISSKTLKFQALTQIPEGSLPVYQSFYQKSHFIQLNAFTTTQLNFNFYFPSIGTFMHSPTNLSLNQIVIAKAQPYEMTVKRIQTKVNLEDFDDLLASGNTQDILNFMKEKNIQKKDGSVKFNLSDTYWLCKEKNFYYDAINILKSKNIFDSTFWSFSIFHNDPDLMKEYLHSLPLKQNLGSGFTSSLISVNNEEESHNIFNFLDYYPLVNARTHKVGGMDSNNSTSSSQQTKRWILNDQLRETYQRFIIQLVNKKEIDSHDNLKFVNYLLMQERVQEAITLFKKIPESFTKKFGKAQLQYDYFKAYFDFYEQGLAGKREYKIARQVISKYKNYPVLQQLNFDRVLLLFSWSKLFDEIAEQIAEIDKVYAPQEEQKVEQKEIDNFQDSQNEIRRKQMNLEPQLDFIIEDEILHVDLNNITQLQVNYYIIDLEIMFSQNPFLDFSNQDFNFVQPFFKEEIKIDSSTISTYDHNIPVDLQKKNMVIEVCNSKSGLKVIKTYFSSKMKVRIFEKFGELKVYFTKENSQEVPLPKSYVKVYQRKKNGEVKFFKDGYTDLRGRFDYGQLSGTSISDIEIFAVFVSNDQYGSISKAAQTPIISSDATTF